MSNLFKKLHILHNIYIKNNFYFSKKSYSMEGEDLKIIKIVKHINNGFFIDVGCYHPLHLSNTYLLYKKNWRGINVDLSKFSIDLFNSIRPEDININSAVSNSEDLVTYYFQKNLSQLGTIKKDKAQKRMQGLIKEKKIRSQKLTTIIENTKYYKRKIDFLNIDSEGADFDILKSLDFDTYRPKLICVEIHDANVERSEINKFLINLNYKKNWSATFSHLYIDKFSSL